MTTLTREKQETRRTPVRADAVVGAAATVAAVGVWSFWTQVAGVDLEVHSGGGVQQVGVGAVLVTGLVVAALGLGLLRVLDARTAHGVRTWTIIATVVFVVSMVGPLGATSPGAGLVLAALHASVALVLVAGLRQVRRQPRPAA